MPDPDRLYEFRCPVYGFIELDETEKKIISHPYFQRLRRIRQLGWTDYVYPGAMHTRFEHSLGVMHMASLLFDGILKRSKIVLAQELGYKDTSYSTYRSFIRAAALLHDIGHAPFSHAGEDLFPEIPNSKKRYKHEHYSSAIIINYFKNIIEESNDYHFTAERIANFIEGNTETGKYLFWRNLISGQLDADRIDYLLRDSLHAGVNYGRFDWQRLVNTVVVVPGSHERDKDETKTSPRIGVSEGGWHAAEGLILARYFMFTQVYFHKTRIIYDHHLRKALKEIIPNGTFPLPTEQGLKEYLDWDDWKVNGILKEGGGGEHGKRLMERNHFREIWHTSESPSKDELGELNKRIESLNAIIAAVENAKTSWYKLDSEDIPIVSDIDQKNIRPLSGYSSLVKNINENPINKSSLYVRKEDFNLAKERMENF